MKLLALFLVAALCFHAHALSSVVPAVPATLFGYSGEDLEDVKDDPLTLKIFVALAPSYVVKAVSAGKIAAKSYSVFLRYVFRQTTSTGYTYVFYLRAYDPTDITVKQYYGTMTAVYKSATKGVSFSSYTVDAGVKRT